MIADRVIQEAVISDFKKILEIKDNELNLKIKTHYDIPRLIEGQIKNKLKFRGNFYQNKNLEVLFNFLKFLNNKFLNKKFGFPRPLVFNTKFNYLIYEEAEGNSLQDLLEFKRIDKEKINYITNLLSDFLVDFHNTNYKTKDFFAQQPTFLIANFKKQFESKVYAKKNLWEDINKLSSMNFKADDQVLLHGDFHAVNIVVSGDNSNLKIIDFSSFCIGDPASDVGSFLAYTNLVLKYHFDQNFADRVMTDFYRNYNKKRSSGSEFYARVKFFEALSYYLIANFALVGYSKDNKKLESTIDDLFFCAKRAIIKIND